MASSQSNLNPANKRKRGETHYNVPIKNSFSIFSDNEDDDEPMFSENVETTNPVEPFPPIIVNKSFEDYKSVLQALNEKMTGEINIKYRKNKTIFITYNINDFNSAQELFKANNWEFHTYTPNCAIKPKYILKGLPPITDTEDIKSDLTGKGVQISNIFQMVYKKVTPNQKLPIWVVTLENKEQIESIMKIKYVCHVVVHWEKYKGSKSLTMCFNCQEFNHLASNCYKKPKCMKCSGDHPSNTCTKDSNSTFTPVCANCEGNHYSNDEKCPIYEKQLNIKQSKNPPKVTLKAFKKQDFPQLPKTSAKWPQGTFQPKDKEPSIFETFKEIKDFLGSLNLTNIFRNIKFLMSKLNAAEDGLSKIFILIEGITSLFD